MTRPSSRRVASRRSVSGTSSTAVRVVPHAAGDFHARGGRCRTPVRFYTRRSAEAAGRESTKAKPDDWRIEVYTQQLRAHRHRLPPSITYHCVDGYYAKKKYIDEVVSLDLYAISTLRSDADCLFLYTGPHPKRRGARRKYAGKVACKTCAISRTSARGQRNRLCICRLPWCGTRRFSVACALWSS